MRVSKTWYLQNNVHLIAISLLLIRLSVINLFFALFLIYLIKVPKKYAFIALMIMLLSQREYHYMDTCTIIEVDEYNLCKGVYNIRIKGEYQVGDEIKLIGDFYEASSASSPFTFDYQKYLSAKKIPYLFYDKGSYVISNGQSIYEIRAFFKEYISTFEGVDKKYTLALLLGDKSDFTEEERLMQSELGISHLFAISGLHVGLLCIVLERILPFQNKKFYISVFVMIYMVIAGFSPSITRAGMMYILSVFLKRYHFTNLDALSIVFIGFYVWNPDVIFDIGFQLSFLVTFSILLTAPKNLLQTSIVAQMATLPIIINLYNQLNLITIFVNIVLVYIMSTIILPMVFLNIVVPIKSLLTDVLLMFDSLIALSNDFSMVIELRDIHPLFIVFYYMFIKKPLLSLIVIPVIMFMPPSEGVYFIDVGQGDSTLIISDEVYLIDTGGNRSFDVYERNVLPLLKSIGVKKIDYLVLTHTHFDHVAGYEQVIDDFNVDNVVISKYAEFNINFDGRLLSAEKGDYIGLLAIMGPDTYHKSINNQSLQIYFELGKSFYLMGDSELKEGFGKVDVLKLGHHGSNTSLNESMFDELSPEVVVISVGRNNYGIPSNEVLEIVEDTQLYRTDFHGTCFYSKRYGFLTTDEYKNIILGYR